MTTRESNGGDARARKPRAVRTASAVASAPTNPDRGLMVRVGQLEARMAASLEAYDDLCTAVGIMCTRMEQLEKTLFRLVERIAQAADTLPGEQPVEPRVPLSMAKGN